MSDATSPLRRILVVDDDEGIREVTETLLYDEGYDVRSAPDGIAALELVSKWPPDVILLDLRMPRLRGEAFCARYLQFPLPRARILIFTAVPGRIDAHSLGADASLEKPYDINDLSERVRQLIAQGLVRS